MGIAINNFASSTEDRASGAQVIDGSLRFDASSYLRRTPSVDGNRKIATLSFWMKQGDYPLNPFNCTNSSDSNKYFSIESIGTGYYRAYSLTIGVQDQYSSSGTPGSYRDMSGWYHMVVKIDNTQNAYYDRVRIYINGVDTGNAGASNTVQNSDGHLFAANTYHDIRMFSIQGSAGGGYLSQFYGIDGQALGPEYFGYSDPLTNTWRPKKFDINKTPSGSWGTNGFYLPLDGNSPIGEDKSGNGNNFTASGFLADNLVSDSPSGIALGTAGNIPQPSNYCTFSPLPGAVWSTYTAVSEGNLRADGLNTGADVPASGTIQTRTGKWYAEFVMTTNGNLNESVGITRNINDTNALGNSTNSYGYITTANKRYNSSSSSYGSTWGVGDIIGVSLDLDNYELSFYKNGVSQGVAYSSLDSNSDWTFAFAIAGNGEVYANFGQQSFAYPIGGSTSDIGYFKSISYTGNGSTQSITGVGFQPDFVWIKKRDSTGNHMLTDVVRGANTELNSNTQNAQSSNTNALTSFDSDGFSVGPDGAVNINSETLQAWCWKAGGAASSNTDGSITSSVSANQTAGFSVVTWNGSTANGTVGHGLDTAPGLIIFKRTDNVTSWPVYTSILGASQVLYLNETAAKAASGNSFGSSPTDPTSTVFSVGDKGDTNYGTMVAYCFAAKTGITSIGSYEGNGLSSGLSVDVGFKPAMVLIKNADAVDDWNIIDNNKPTEVLRPNSTSAEDSSAPCHITPTGFKITFGNSHRINYANETFVYIAFAENYTAPKEIDEYKALCTANLPRPSKVAVRPDKYFNTVLYTGNQTARDITVADDTGNAWQPDFVWLKSRAGTVGHHGLFDSVRGANNGLYSSLNYAEAAFTQTLTSFNSDGFSLGTDADWGGSNWNSTTYVAWCWKAGGAAVENTDGSITSQVSANQDAGFSIVTYTASGSSGATVGHGLDVAPSFIVVKNRDYAQNWFAYHQYIGGAGGFNFNTTQAAFTSDAGYWNSTNPSSSLITLGNYHGYFGTHKYIAYCFAEVEGYSKFGSYTGNGNADGPFIHCGFKPAWIMIKNTTTAQGWYISDNKRDTYNQVNRALFANTADAESTSSTGASYDFLSNGFKPRTSNNDSNGSGDTYIFAAFAEAPSNNLFGGQANAR
jgi:hypothetical protein